jgi:transcriptional regulator with XRE-family HTH domain
MSKPIFQFTTANTEARNGNTFGASRRSPLSELVSDHLRAKGLRQVDFCRQTGFDQGLLSKILSSVVTTLNVESALRLAEGLEVQPSVIFEAIGKKDVDDMLRRFYSDAKPPDRVL